MIHVLPYCIKTDFVLSCKTYFYRLLNITYFEMKTLQDKVIVSRRLVLKLPFSNELNLAILD